MSSSVHEISTDGQHLREVFKATGGPYGSISKITRETETARERQRQKERDRDSKKETTGRRRV